MRTDGPIPRDRAGSVRDGPAGPSRTLPARKGLRLRLLFRPRPEPDEIVPADDDARLIVRTRAHAIDREFARGGLGHVQRGLLRGDLTRRHQEVDILPWRDAELRDQIDFRPAVDLAGVPVDHGAEQLAGAVVQEPDAIGRLAWD